MLRMKLDEITAADLDELVQQSIIESTTLEFKRELPGSTDQDKKEFLADLTALSNTQGGDLIYGIEAADGCAVKVAGIPATLVDAELLRLTSLITSGVEPRIRYDSRAIEHPTGRVLIFRAEKSWNAPHRVTLKGHDKFYARTSAGKYTLDVQQLRSAFLQNSSVTERLRDFRSTRLIEIIAGRTPIPMVGESKLVLHILPIESFATTEVRDLAAPHSQISLVRPMNSSGWNERITLEGRLTFAADGKNQVLSYAHFYRNGIVEAVEATVLNHVHEDGTKNLPSVAYERAVIARLSDYLKFLESNGFRAPIVIALTLTSVRGARIGINNFWSGFDVHPVLQDHLVLPEQILQSFDDDIIASIRPSFDSVWNACGMPASENFNASGQWEPRTY